MLTPRPLNVVLVPVFFVGPPQKATTSGKKWCGYPDGKAASPKERNCTHPTERRTDWMPHPRIGVRGKEGRVVQVSSRKKRGW